MFLEKVRIQNFKCIVDSEEFSLAPVTCLVGKNESGKSALLEALHKLNPVYPEEADFDDVIEYPRRKWSEYSMDMRDACPDNVLDVVWELAGADIAAAEEALGVSGVVSPNARVRKGYSNKREWEFDLDQKRLVGQLLCQSDLHEEELQPLRSATSVSELCALLRGIDTPSARHAGFLKRLEDVFVNDDAHQTVVRILERRMPKFLYVPEYNRMSGQVSLSNMRDKIARKALDPGDRVFLALMRLAGRTIDDISGISQFEELIAELEAVSSRVSDELFDYWTQNRHLRVQFRFDDAQASDPAPFNSGKIFRTRIWNDLHRASVSFDERSTGFVWFFSFLVWFSQLKDEYGDNLLILLDEPGLGLHAKAQQDLLRYIRDRLEPRYQVVYTAHSPFMVDPENLLRVRTVEDVLVEDEHGRVREVLGTKVGDEVLSTDADTVFPLQAALGYDITQTLFVGEHTLIVEGPSDLLYIQWFSHQLNSQGRGGLDRRWTICPSGGVSKIGSFLALFGGQKLHLAVFTDYHHGIKGKVRELRESELLKDGHVFSADMYADGEEADIEDLLGRSNYVHLVNECYSLAQDQRLPVERPGYVPERVVQEVAEKFRTLPAQVPDFDHYAPAEYLMSKGHGLIDSFPESGEALERFENLFKDLNSLLGTHGM